MPHARARIPPTAAEHCRATCTLPSRPPRRQLRLAEGPVARLVPPSVNTGAYVRQRHNPSPHNIHARVGRPSDRRPARTQLTAPFVRLDRRAEVRSPPVARSPHLCTRQKAATSPQAPPQTPLPRRARSLCSRGSRCQVQRASAATFRCRSRRACTVLAMRLPAPPRLMRALCAARARRVAAAAWERVGGTT